MNRSRVSLYIVTLIAVALTVIRPTQAPVPQFDEGWVMSVAHNWKTFGHYGQMRDGVPAPASILNIGFPVVGPVALSFRVFGTGVWQARLPGMVYTLMAFALLYLLTRRLYSPSVALGSLVLLLLVTPLTPVLWGRQVLGELPAIALMLAGYLVLSLAGSPRSAGPAAGALFALAALTKLQALPFLVISLLVTMAWLGLNREWRQLWRLGQCLLTLFALFFGLRYALGSILGYTVLPGLGRGLYGTTAVATGSAARFSALAAVMLYGLPTCIGVLGSARSLIQHSTASGKQLGSPAVTKFALVVLVAGWLGWFLLLSIAWVRYLVPPVFVGSIFLSNALHNWTSGFSLKSTAAHTAALVGRRETNRIALGALLATVIVTSGAVLTLNEIGRRYLAPEDRSLELAVSYLNTETSPDALIETYQMEFFPFLKRRYHYPPDDVQQQLNSRTWLQQDVTVDYDPLAADPDYIVVGSLSATWGLYDGVTEDGQFRLVRKYPAYLVYERVR